MFPLQSGIVPDSRIIDKSCGPRFLAALGKYRIEIVPSNR